MITILAYILVIPLVQFAYTLGYMLSIVIISPFNVVASAVLRRDKDCKQADNPLVGLPTNALQAVVSGLITGASGGIAAVAFGFGVFALLVGKESFGLWPFCATILPLTIPLWNDYRLWLGAREEWRERKVLKMEGDTEIDSVNPVIGISLLASARNMAVMRLMAVLGALAGLVLGGWLFLAR